MGHSHTKDAQSGWTALHHAAAAGHAECVKALGEAGERALVDLRTWEVLFFHLPLGWVKYGSGRDGIGIGMQELAEDQERRAHLVEDESQYQPGHQ